MDTSDYISIVLWGGVALWVLGSNFKDGLWSNALMLFSVFFAAAIGPHVAGLIAPLLSSHIEGTSFEKVAMAAVNWIPFLIVLAITRVLTDRLSKVQVRFPKQMEFAGGMLFMLLTVLFLFVFVSSIGGPLNGKLPGGLEHMLSKSV